MAAQIALHVLEIAAPSAAAPRVTRRSRAIRHRHSPRTTVCEEGSTGATAVLGAAATAYAISYLKSEDKIILNDGTELVGSIIFKSETLVVMMVEGVEKRMWMVDVRKIEQADESTGMVGVIPGTEKTKATDAEGEEDDGKQEDGDEQQPGCDRQSKKFHQTLSCLRAAGALPSEPVA